MSSNEKILITGGAGFIGSNLALKLSKNYDVYSLDNFHKSESKKNIKNLEKNKIKFIECDIRDKEKLFKIIDENEFSVIFHFAAQVAMTKSIEDPELDFEINVNGTLNLLNALVKFSPETKFVNISSNKVYGDLFWDDLKEEEKRYVSSKFKNGYNEETQLEFSGPYGCSKGAAEQYVLDYKKTFGVKSLSLRLSTIFGMNQFFTFDQGWIGWFISEFIKFNNNDIDQITIQGDGKQVRDILFINDLVELFEKIIDKDFTDLSQNYFNVGGGVKNSLSIIELLDFLKKYFKSDKEIVISKNNFRLGDQKYYVSDIKKVSSNFDWVPKTNIEAGIVQYLNWIQKH